MRRFRMDRDRDCVAQAVLFSDGTVVLHWLGKVASTAVYPSLAAFKAVHVEGHDGTRLRWEDKCCFACGTPEHHAGVGWCSACGATWDGEGNDEPDPSQGRWVPAIKIGGAP